MRILFIIDGLRAGGKERQLIELIKGLSLLKDNEFKYELILMNEDVHYKEVYNLNIKIHYLIRKNKKDFSLIFKLNKIYKNFQPDIIHTWDWMSTFYAVILKLFHRFILINGSIRYGLSIKRLSKLWILGKLLFPFSDVIVANSLAGLNVHKLAPSKKNRCIYNGFDFERIKILADKEIIRKKFDINTKYVIGMVANFTENKDYKTYLMAAQRILKKRTNVTFICIGDGPEIKEMKSIVDLEYRGKIKFLGRMSDLESIINIFDIGILACNTNGHAEGNSNAIMEYMALGKPVIATKSGGNKELIIDNITGFLIEPFSVNELVKKSLILLDDTSRRKKLGDMGKKRIMDKFNLNNMVGSYKKLYSNMMQTDRW